MNEQQKIKMYVHLVYVKRHFKFDSTGFLLIAKHRKLFRIVLLLNYFVRIESTLHRGNAI